VVVAARFVIRAATYHIQDSQEENTANNPSPDRYHTVHIGSFLRSRKITPLSGIQGSTLFLIDATLYNAVNASIRAHTKKAAYYGGFLSPYVL
jgi:hypothetical protein